MIHFAYPNVKPSEGKFIGCGRYLATEQPPSDAYFPATPAVMDLAELQMAAAALAPESFETEHIVYQKKDHPKEIYRGNSQHFAYLLALLSRSRPLKSCYAQSDIWCTGSISLPGEHPVLKPVAHQEFTWKLSAFLSDENQDRIFLIPMTVLLSEHEIMLKEHSQTLNVVTLKEFSEKDEKAFASHKTILKLHGHELAALRDILFLPPESTTQQSGSSSSSKTWKPHWQYRVGEKIGAVAIDAQGKTVVAATLGKKALGFNSEGQLLWQKKIDKEVWRIAVSPDGKKAIIGSWNRFPMDITKYSLRCVDAADGSLLWQDSSKSSVWSLAYSADGSTIAAGMSDEMVLWESEGTRTSLQNNKGFVFLYNTWTFAIELSEDGSIVAGVTGSNKQVHILKRNGAVLGKYQTEGGVYALSMSSTGEVIGAGDDKGYLYRLNQQGKVLWRERLADRVNAVAVDRAGQQLWAGTGKKDGHVRVYDSAGRLVWRQYVNGTVSTLAVSADGQRGVVGTEEGGIFLFENDGTLLHQASADKTIRQVVISTNGERVVAASFDGVIYGFELV